MKALFGPAGNGDLFYKNGHKTSEEMPEFLSKYGLGAYEYQCGNGVRIGEDAAKRIGLAAKNNNIVMSLHSPYYINLANPDEEKRKNSINYIIQSMTAVKAMGGKRVVVHSGALQKMTREEALSHAVDTVKMAISEADALGFSDIHMCIETMGKINQLGNLDEVLELCSLDDRLLPTIDFGHLNARTLGGLDSYESFLEIFDKIENKLGSDRLKVFHSHFSKIEYTKGGEKKHLTFEDKEFGPDFSYVAEIVYKKNISPIFICESAGTQIEDSLTMKKM
ncbi:MAG: TIM barrel protein, partial [Clostridia bacterium]|nr:TIM barrel protein [Clostridia bacterium]